MEWSDALLKKRVNREARSQPYVTGGMITLKPMIAGMLSLDESSYQLLRINDEKGWERPNMSNLASLCDSEND
ncbi:hypothetical protein CEXT_703931 [Caerostris extrusa]|uniref:Uncharacterized protein n=1 Tax=Caerostris extrusa TaxID=172846 RepID=A0AAV4P294_CAEEX|nr:hypothetical protein CEXT_703931 [Caerostris extrusa]